MVSLNKMRVGDELFYDGSFYKIDKINLEENTVVISNSFFYGKDSYIIDYNLTYGVYPCYACQGGGCPVCNGMGRIVEG